MEDESLDKKSGCGLLNAVLFGRRSFWPRRSTSTGSIPSGNGPDFVKRPGSPNSRRRRSGSDDSAVLETASEPSSRPVARPTQIPQRAPPVYHQNHGRKVSNEAALVVPSSGTGPTKIASSQGYVNQGRKVPKEAIGISGELESIIADHQKARGGGNLVRASSSNVMLYGNLGNLRQPGGGNVDAYNIVDPLPKTAREASPMPKGNYANSVMGNVVKSANKEGKPSEAQSGQFCRALSTRIDPETLKIMGNEDYKNGRFAEALALYDAAISIDPDKASYRSNKSAALTALGRLLEAVFECREAIQIEPHYHRAHHRLATLYLRLGEADKALYHFKHAGPEADHDDIAKVKMLQAHLNKCTEARKLRDWNTLIKETGCAISAGADSAPQIVALQAEGLLKLHRHQDADETMLRGPNFEVDALTKFLGPIGSAYWLVIRAQVDMAAGRLDDALEAIQRAARLDSNNREANVVLRKAKAVAGARSKGNELFKASRYSEACSAYGAGLELDPYNSVLLCNRAACWSKLGQFEGAVEDCNAALNVRPAYSKARLRRADCNAKLEKWEASIADYEILLKETPEDEELRQALSKAQVQLKKQRGEDVQEINNNGVDSVSPSSSRQTA